jgi:hypothetical protein
MKHLYIIALVVVVLVSCAHGAEQGKHLFILSGQSNMVGLNPKKTFTPALVEEFGKDNVIVVKDAEGGQPIRRWYKQWKLAEGDDPQAIGDLYDRLMTQVDAATKGKSIETVTFVWMQGERDAVDQQEEVYAASLRGLYDQLCGDLGRDDINFVIGRISDHDLAGNTYPHWSGIRRAQVEVAESNPRFIWVDTDDLNDGQDPTDLATRNGLHYTPEGYNTLGQRFADAAIDLINHMSGEWDADNGK